MPDDAPPPNVTMTDVLALPDRQCQLVTWLMRQGQAEIDAIADFLDADVTEAHAVVAELVRCGFVAEVDDRAGVKIEARVVEQRRRRAPSTLWDVLDCSVGRLDET